MAQTLPKVEEHELNADCSELFHLITERFYSKAEVSIRELISNSSDALNKAKVTRLKNLTNPALAHMAKEEPDFKIDLILQPKTEESPALLKIIDNGVGMTKKELIDNLSTIAHSGTRDFIKAIKEGLSDVSMIGKFGVGFFSCFLISKKVQVKTFALIPNEGEENKGFIWTSEGGNKYTIEEIERENEFKNGTEITLWLKDKCEDYTDASKIKKIVKKYSGFVSFPIISNYWKEVSIESEKPSEGKEVKEGEEKEEGEAEIKEQKEEEKEEKEEKEKEKKKELVTERLNPMEPLWTRNKNEITPKEYEDFYKEISNDWEKHLAVCHFKVEGDFEYTAVLFIPARAPFDLFENKKKKRNIKLYVKRVFIMDDCEKMVPDWLSFCVGVIDSEHLDLNVSREILQEGETIKNIRKNITKKLVEKLTEMKEASRSISSLEKEGNEKTDWEKFTEAFGKSLKLGVHEESAYRERLAELLGFESSLCDLRFSKAKGFGPFGGGDFSDPSLIGKEKGKGKGKGKGKKRVKKGKEGKTFRNTTLDEYIERMKEVKDQKEIYYISAESLDAARNSPFLEGYLERGVEVLFLTEPIDEYVVAQLRTYKGFPLSSITKTGATLPEAARSSGAEKAPKESENKEAEKDKKEGEDAKENKKEGEEEKELIEAIKKVLKVSVEDVIISNKLKSSPASVASSKMGYSANYERILKSQALRDNQMFGFMLGKKVLEINPKHKVIQNLKKMDFEGSEFKNGVKLMFYVASLASGYSLEKPKDLSRRVYKMIGGSEEGDESADSGFEDEEGEEEEDDEKGEEGEKEEEEGDGEEEEEEEKGKVEEID